MFTKILERKCSALVACSKLGGYGMKEPFSLLIDLDEVRKLASDCKSAFPSHFKHCFAIKANPTRKILTLLSSMGLGFEAASIGELTMAGRADKNAFCVYDSPLKSERDIRAALDTGATLNIDNFQELDVVASVMEEKKGSCKSTIGIRVNPQVGGGSLAGFSTGTLTSKFGIGLKDDEGVPIVNAFKKFDWLTCLMCHVGSQGIPFDLAIQGIRETVDFALKVNLEVGRKQVTMIDIGGGMSVNFTSDEIKPTFQQYSDALKKAVPELFDEKQFSCVVTEFGRALVAKAGFFASRVEYVKTTGGRRIAIQYAGADTCVRTVYHPKEWPLRVTTLNDKLEPRGGEGVDDEFQKSLEGGIAPTDIAGPCCIQADIVAHERPLPPLHRGDTILLHDVGGYYHSGHTRYNLRQAPCVWGFEGQGKDMKLTLLQASETVDETLDAFCEPEFKKK